MTSLLHPRHRLFVEEYLVDLNAAAAARRAGYAPRSASKNCGKLMRRPDIAAAIDAAMAARARRMRVTAERVLEEYARIAFHDYRNYADWGEMSTALKPSRALDADAAAAIAGIAQCDRGAGKVARLTLFDKKAALDSLARILDLGEHVRQREIALRAEAARRARDRWRALLGVAPQARRRA